MATKFADVKVSIVLAYSKQLPYADSAFNECLQAAAGQDHPQVEVIVVDDRGRDARLDLQPLDPGSAEGVHHLPGDYAGRGAMYNAGVRAATGEFVLLVFNDRAQVTLRKSAASTMVMAAVRHDSVGMVYGDYELIDADGQRKDIHLLDWHAGRLRDTVDFGAAVMISTDLLRGLGGFNEELKAADFYDLRLRVCENHPPLHIANRFAGSLYSVAAPPKSHNVFDYLLADKDSQLEMERVLTDHLRRCGTHLAPGVHVNKVEYSPDEEGQYDACVASVVVPVNNRPQFIGRAVESVLAQTVKQVEVIVVVNGGPSDPTAEAVRRYMEGGDRYQKDAPPVRLIVVDMNNLGLCLNAGISAARGKYYVQLDSDDRLKPFAVEKLLQVFDADPTVGMVIGSYEVWNLDESSGSVTRNEDIPVVTHDEWTADNGRNNLLRINGAGAPRSAHIKVIRDAGWFGVNDDPSCRNYGEDYDLVLRISERQTIGRVWDPIYDVIRHAGGTDHSIDQATIDRNDDAKDHMRLAALRRRRNLNANASG